MSINVRLVTVDSRESAVLPVRPRRATIERSQPHHAAGADHEGIVHEITRGLASEGISIESMETGTVAAPTTGTPLFTMSATVVVPPTLRHADWTATLDATAVAAGVDIEVSETT